MHSPVGTFASQYDAWTGRKRLIGPSDWTVCSINLNLSGGVPVTAKCLAVFKRDFLAPSRRAPFSHWSRPLQGTSR